MKKYLLRISFIVSLVCGFLLGSAVETQGAVAERQHDKQPISFLRKRPISYIYNK